MTKCIVFPGQGSQYLGMGKHLYDNFNVSKYIFDEVDDALNLKLSRIIFGDDPTNMKPGFRIIFLPISVPIPIIQ